MQKEIKKEKNTNTKSVGIRAAPEEAAKNGGVLHNSIAPIPYTIFGSPDDELQQLAQEPLFQMYAEVGQETYEIIARCNPTLKAVIDLAKEICGGGQ